MQHTLYTKQLVHEAATSYRVAQMRMGFILVRAVKLKIDPAKFVAREICLVLLDTFKVIKKSPVFKNTHTHPFAAVDLRTFIFTR